MSVFNEDVIALPEINADIIRDVADFKINNHRTHEELMEIINDIVHGIYYNAKVGVYPEKGEWMYEGRLFGIPQAYATGWISKNPPPPSWKKIYDETRDTIDYIERIFTQLGFEFEYIKSDKNIGVTNCVVIRIPFKTQNFESFTQRVYSKTIASDLVSVQSLGAPEAKLMFMDMPYNKKAACKCNYGAI